MRASVDGRFGRMGLLAAAGLAAWAMASCAGRERVGADPMAAVNTVARDRDVWQQLLADHASIRRTVTHRVEGGVAFIEATTESDDPAVAARIVDHAKAMQARMKAGAQVRVWDPVFKELFKRHDRVALEVTPTSKGVTIVESSGDPETIALMRSHAAGVSEFVRDGHRAGQRETRRVAAGSPTPADEVAIGGVQHRFLLGQPDASQLDLLKGEGVTTIVNFRKPTEHPGYDERSEATSRGMAYCNLAYREASELTDELLDQARAAIREADGTGAIVALHCRTGNRVGPAWAAYRAIDAGVPLERAIAEAKALRMADPRLEAAVRGYVGRRLAAGS